MEGLKYISTERMHRRICSVSTCEECPLRNRIATCWLADRTTVIDVYMTLFDLYNTITISEDELIDVITGE